MGSVEAAKAYLMKANAEGLSLYDHLAEVVSKLLAEKPEDALEQIEAISAKINLLPGLVVQHGTPLLYPPGSSAAAAGGGGALLLSCPRDSSHSDGVFSFLPQPLRLRLRLRLWLPHTFPFPCWYKCLRWCSGVVFVRVPRKVFRPA